MSFSPALFLLFGIPLLQVATTVRGIKMVVRHTAGGMSSEQTLYIAPDRKRVEFRNSTGGPTRPDGSMVVRYGPPLAAITRCDLGQSFELNLDTNEYVAAPYPPKPLSQTEIETRGLKAPKFSASDNPTLRIEITTVDTGERRDVFGHTARHVITTTRQIPLLGSKSLAQQTVTDGWYIDLDTRISCDRKWTEGKRVHHYLASGNAPIEKMEFVDKGEPERGFPVELKTTSLHTILLPDGGKQEHTSTNETLVSVLEEGPLDSKLFDTPPGFRQVEHIERNPTAVSPSGWSVAWYQLKTKVARLFQ
jgi:hypothetical protein